MNDIRFPTVVQMMLSLALAHSGGIEALSSADLAEGANTNATVIRKLLPPLLEAGLVRVTRGREGGISLARDAAAITLADLHSAVFADEPLWHGRGEVPHRCLVTRNIGGFFAQVTAQATAALRESLGRQSLSDCLAEFVALDQGRA